MTNFKEETMRLIGDHKIDEYRFEYIRDWYHSNNPIYIGKDKIAWDGIQASMLNYDKGYGTQYWRGFITFKDTADWLERESYDGMEWWVWRSKPSLEEEERKLYDKNI
jgi:hypothetical protein